MTNDRCSLLGDISDIRYFKEISLNSKVISVNFEVIFIHFQVISVISVNFKVI